MSNMQIARTNFVSKTRALSTVARNASCSRGWVRVVVQSIFAVITVCSFILIVLMAMQNSSLVSTNRPNPLPASRCYVNNCRVFCREVPYYGQYEEHIIYTVSEAEAECKRIYLVLNSPIFVNYTMPPYWMPKLRTNNIYELTIIRGNLKHIAPEAFMSQFARRIHILILQNITIQTLGARSIVGLFSLEKLFITDCEINSIQKDSLRPVDDTLESLTLSRSNHWNPVNVSGTTFFKLLSSVDFSFNYFGDILDSSSFVGLQRCKILYLNSCKITALGPGTFDHLHNIDIIYLNNNLLATLPPGLFNNIMSAVPKPRINLQDNLWHCDCSSNDLRLLVTNNLLYVEPLCYDPIILRGKSFTEYETYCQSKQITPINMGKYSCNSSYAQFKDDVYLDGTCYGHDLEMVNNSFKIQSPLLRHKCSTTTVNNTSIIDFVSTTANDMFVADNKWLRLKFFLKTERYSVVQMDSSGISGYGLVWYQSTCPKEIYCVSVLPDYLIVYNFISNARYTFCPVEINTGVVEVNHCIGYNTSEFDVKFNYDAFQIVMYFCTGLVCLVVGALCLYAVIRNNPSLLKGSKRILFVKHKTVDALVLPPKIPLRNSIVKVTPPENYDSKIFIVSNDKLNSSKYNTLKSVKSENSSTPSYVSALQPTDDQLAEWRIHHHFNNDITRTSSTDLSVFSWLHKGDSLYYSLESDNDKTYESLK